MNRKMSEDKTKVFSRRLESQLRMELLQAASSKRPADAIDDSEVFQPITDCAGSAYTVRSWLRLKMQRQ